MKFHILVISLLLINSFAYAQPDAGPKSHTAKRALKHGLHEMKVIQDGKMLSKEVYNSNGKQTHQINYRGKSADTVKQMIYNEAGKPTYIKNWKEERKFAYDDNGYLLSETKYRGNRLLYKAEYNYGDDYRTVIKTVRHKNELENSPVTFITKEDTNGRLTEYLYIINKDTAKHDRRYYEGGLTKIHFYQPGLSRELPFLDKTIVVDSTGFEFKITKNDLNGEQKYEEINRNDTTITDKEIKIAFIKNDDIYKNVVIRFNERGDTSEVWELLGSRDKNSVKYEYYDDGRLKSKFDYSNRRFVRKIGNPDFNPDSMAKELGYEYEYLDDGTTKITSYKANGDLRFRKTIDKKGNIIQYEKLRNFLRKKKIVTKSQLYDYEYNDNGDIVMELIRDKRKTECKYDDRNLLIRKKETNLYNNRVTLHEWEYSFHD